MTVQIDTSQQARIVVTGEFPISVTELWPYFTTAEGLTRWWPQVAEIDCRENGRYTLSWPTMAWTLRGQYSTVIPNQQLTFSWQWDHLPHLSARTVDIRFKPHPTGSRIILTHADYTIRPEDLADRQHHIDGWTHFLGQLATIIQAQ